MTGTSTSDVIIFNTDNSHIDYYQLIALRLRELGVRVDLYLEKKKITAQFKYAQAHNIPFGIFISDEEKSLGQFTLRRLSDRTDFKEMQVESAAVKIGEEV